MLRTDDREPIFILICFQRKIARAWKLSTTQTEKRWRNPPRFILPFRPRDKVKTVFEYFTLLPSRARFQIARALFSAQPAFATPKGKASASLFCQAIGSSCAWTIHNSRWLKIVERRHKYFSSFVLLDGLGFSIRHFWHFFFFWSFVPLNSFYQCRTSTYPRSAIGWFETWFLWLYQRKLMEFLYLLLKMFLFKYAIEARKETKGNLKNPIGFIIFLWG
jgi:hypothetical protein